MGKQYLIRLIEKFRRGQATHEEQEQLDRRWPAPWRIAASLTGLLLLAGLGAWFWWQQPVRVQTAYGETRTLTLPDGSAVTLNGNSSLRYARRWSDHETRELWLDGEGFFEVKTIRHATGQKVNFQVHTSQVDVNVLGTGFNVSDRRGRTSVVLQHGVVQVVDRTRPGESVLMQPGERVVREPNRLLTKEQVDPQQFLTWQQRQLLFYNTRLADIFAQLEDSYGVRVVCDDPRLLNETFSGAVPTDSLPLFFQKIEKLFAVGVTREGDTYRLR